MKTLNERYFEIAEAMNFYTQEAKEARLMYYLILYYLDGQPLKMYFDIDSEKIKQLHRKIKGLNNDQIFELLEYYLNKSLDYEQAIEAYTGDF